MAYHPAPCLHSRALDLGNYIYKSLKIGTLGVAAAMVQLTGYGTGFIRAYVWKIILGHGRDINDEIERRRGK